MDSKKLALRLMVGWITIYVIAGITALLYETGTVPKGTVTDNKTIYIMQVVGVLLSLAMIPVALRGFRKMIDRMEDRPFESRVKIYETVSWIRLAAFFVVIEYGVLLYYLINDDIGLYCALIGTICSLFCIPQRSAVEYDLDWKKNE